MTNMLKGALSDDQDIPEENREDQDNTAQRIANTLPQGVLFVNAEGEVLWMDQRTRCHINGGLGKLKLPLNRAEGFAGADCFVTVREVDLEQGPQQLCVIQAIAPDEASERDLRSVIGSVEDVLEEVMADSSWFTKALVEKLKAKLQAGRPARAADLERLTAREREILVLVCEGHTDAEMGRLLKLSQNTVRNHLASLFRKIGVNRRSDAVIWARERAITKHDIRALSYACRDSRAP